MIDNHPSLKQEIPLPAIRNACENRFASFCYLLQDDGWMDPVHERLCDWIQGHIDKAFPKGVNLDDPALTKTLKLAVIMPRGSLKTTFCNRNLSAWLPIRFGTDIRSLMVTNTHPNAKKKMEAIKSVITGHEGFRAVFPEIEPEKNRWNSEIAILRRKGTYEDGTYESAGVGTAKTGSHYNVIIEDDTLAPDSDEMGEDITLPSHESMERSIGYHKAAHPLLVPKGVRIRIVVSTRWGEGDLIDHIQKKAEGWHFFNIPALNAERKPIFSMFYSEESLRSIEREIGPYMFSCLYLNHPLDPRQKTFKPEQIERATGVLPSPTEMEFFTLSVDPAISKESSACDTGISVCGHRKVNGFPHIYVYHVSAGKFTMGETVEETLRLYKNFDPLTFRAVIVENIAYQQALLERLTEEFRMQGLPQRAIPFSSRTNKLDRIRNTLEPLFFSDRIHLDPNLPPETFNQLDQFPNGKFLDILDCISFHPHQMTISGRKENPPAEQEELSECDIAIQEIRARHAAYKNRMRTPHVENQSIPFPGTLRQSAYRRAEARFA